MIRSVLVPLDGSPLAEQALEYASDIVALGGRLTLLSVIEIPADYDYALVDVPLTMMTVRVEEGAYDSLVEKTRSYLDAQANVLRARGFEVDTIVTLGVPADEILEHAEELKVDAIVMSTHGRRGFSKWLFGSVAQKVISVMPCPVMVVPGRVPEKAEEPIASAAAAPKSAFST